MYDTFDKSDFKVKFPPTDDLIYLLRSVLENNVFEFDGKLFIQKIGVAIGAVQSSECCDILMFQIMKDIFSKFEFLNKKSKKHTKEIPLVLSTKYNPCIRKIKQCLVKHWQLLKHNEICRDIFTKEPIIAYKKHRNFGDILTSSKIIKKNK